MLKRTITGVALIAVLVVVFSCLAFADTLVFKTGK